MNVSVIKSIVLNIDETESELLKLSNILTINEKVIKRDISIHKCIILKISLPYNSK